MCGSSTSHRSNDPDLIVPTVAEAVAAPTSAALDPTAAVLEHLRGRRAMVIMDNCEHLVAGVAKHVDELLRRCPLVSVVATSREPLGLARRADLAARASRS